MAGKVDYNALRAQTMGSGLDEEAVTVNTRALIDKVLARYSGEWTTLRELLQNAADATASRVMVKFETLPSSSVPLPQSSNTSAHLQHTILHHSLKRLVVSNNGQPFGPNDWSRLKRIAEGNPDETKIGAFGVGFYSVFSDCEEPFVSSGKEAMAFYWKGNSLFTRRMQLSESQASNDTTFVLDYRSTTSPVPPILPLAQFLASSMTFVGLTNIELWLDDWKLLELKKLVAPGYTLEIPRGLNTKTQEGIMKVGAVSHETAQLDAKWLSVVGWKPKTAVSSTDSAAKGGPSGSSLRSFFSKFAASNNSSAAAAKAAQQERAAQEAISEDLVAECKATVFLHVNTATITTSVSKSFGTELERATKKPAPKTTKIAVLTGSHEQVALDLEDKDSPSRLIDIFASVLPSKSGRIYIGFPTHQTTGLSAHVSAPSVIPTVERESIDLNARWVRTWNQEMLRAVGIVSRIAWTGAIDLIRTDLMRQMKASGSAKVRHEDVTRVLPQAIHLLNQYTFRESTPSSQVGTLIEEAFWTCNSNASIEILSSRGILPSQHVRLATDELSFVEGIPVVPQELMEKANGFVKRLVDYGIITDVTTGDIKKELEAQALNTKQMIEFLSWVSHKAKIEDVDMMTIKSLLDSAVVNDEVDGKVWILGDIKHFINPSRIPATMPAPQNTLPFKFTKGLDRSDLSLIGWEDLTIVPWLRFLVENTGGHGQLTKDQDITSSKDFAGQVLSIVSKQWDGLSQSSKTSVLNILSSQTTIPTKMGMRKPDASYFPSVKLFDDLPVVTVNAVKEKFLAALGVRKTIELDLVFDRLLRSEESSSKAAWSHVDLIKYLASVRSDIPQSDIVKLSGAAICSTEGSDNPKSTSEQKRFRVSELYEPNDQLRALGLKILYWPGLYRPVSEEGRFLKTLGIRTHPTVPELINIITVAASQNDQSLRDRALRYLVDFHHQHGYSTDEIRNAPVPFLPLENKVGLALPSKCFTNEKVSMMGYDILKKDLHANALKLGVQSDPPIAECANWLVKNPPTTNRDARQVFEYFASRLDKLNGRVLELLGEASMVPVTESVSEKSQSLQGRPTEKRTVRHLPPKLVFLGSGGRYAEIFDYVDFGTVANSFLLRCGSKNEPSTKELTSLVVREPARIFSTFGSADRYLDLLGTIAKSWNFLKKDKDLVREMKRSAFLLAYVEYPVEKSSTKPAKAEDFDDDDTTVRTCQLARADQVLIADDVVNYSLFKGNVLSAPPDEDIEGLYMSLGSKLLSNVVEEMPKIGPALREQATGTQLKKLVLERIKLFYHDLSHDQIRRDPTWIEKNLNFVAVSSLSVRKTLANTSISYTQTIGAIPGESSTLGKVIYFLAGNRDYFYVSQALLHLCLHRSKPQQAIILTTLLESDLQRLRARGYDVSRILKKKAAEARIAEENRHKQLEEERERMKAQEETRRERAVQQQHESMMPGVFPDSPDRHAEPNRDLTSLQPQDDNKKRPKGLFSALQRSLGIDSDKRSSAELPQLHQLPGYVNNFEPKAPTKGPESQISKPVTSPGQLQQNLLNAISSSRAHNSSTVQSDPVMNDVKETQTFCDTKPGQNISFFGEAAYGIKLFLSNTMQDKQRFMAANSSALNSFAGIMITVAGALRLSRSSLHLFYDADSSTIAFNQNRSLFFNYRYFETLHLPDIQNGRNADAIVYWFVTTCHELAHNIISDHSAAHSYYTESFVAQFFGNVAQTIAGPPPATTQSGPALDPPPSYST